MVPNSFHEMQLLKIHLLATSITLAQHAVAASLKERVLSLLMKSIIEESYWFFTVDMS